MHPKSQSYDVQFLSNRVRQAEFFVILGSFLPFTTSPPSHLMMPKIKILRKNVKKCLEILSFYTYMCTINQDHMIYGSWNIMCDRQKFSSFYPFSPLTTWKIKILTLKKTPGDIIFHICTINDNHMMYGPWDMEHNRHNFLSFWTIFCPLTPLGTWKIKILKK